MWGGPYPGGVLFVFADGSVKSLSYSWCNGTPSRPTGVTSANTPAQAPTNLGAAMTAQAGEVYTQE